MIESLLDYKRINNQDRIWDMSLYHTDNQKLRRYIDGNSL